MKAGVWLWRKGRYSLRIPLTFVAVIRDFGKERVISESN